jgi:transcriptional regulator with XRE-family HTH domain
MDLFEHVGQRIRELRMSYGDGEISQEALAKALGVASNTISRWETATNRPDLADLDRLARFFGVSILTFFPPDESPKEEVSALLRAAQQLSKEDVEELRRYAEFRRARSLYSGREKPRPGRKRKA